MPTERCSKCDGKGWVESWQAVGATWTPALQQCPKRCNISGYSSEVQRRLSKTHVTERRVVGFDEVEANNPKPVAKVLPLFRRP